jgi:TonB family protein
MPGFTKLFIYLFSAVIILACFPAPRFALAEAANSMPLNEYCDRVRAQIVKDGASKFTWAKAIDVSVGLDESGKIIDSDNDKEKDEKHKNALDVLMQLGNFPAPPANSKKPFWLTISTSKENDKIAVCVRDVDYQAYMAELQGKIKHGWYPPKGDTTLRVGVVFHLHRDGHIDGLKITDGGGKPENDGAALAAVNSAVPFAPLPDGSPESVDIQFTFDYNVFNRGKKTASSTGNVPENQLTSGQKAIFCLRDGLSAMNAKNFPAAVQSFETGINLDPSNEALKKNLSITYDYWGADLLKTNPDQAMEKFAKASVYWAENPMTPKTVEGAHQLYDHFPGTNSQPAAANQSPAASPSSK